MKLYHLVIPFLCIIVGACGVIEKPVPIAIERVPLNLAMPAQPALNDFHVRAINKDNAQTVMQQEDGGFFISAEDYKILRTNLEKLSNKIVEYKVTLDQYIKYYEPPKNSVDTSKVNP